MYGTKCYKIGEGAYGAVHKYRKGNDLYAIKTFTEYDYKSKGHHYSIFREIASLSYLQHPNIIKIHDILYENDDVRLVMDYCCENIRSILTDVNDSKFQSFTSQIPFISYQIANALAFCINNNILHRDLKPDNILIDEDNYHIYLIDFGLTNINSKSRKNIPLTGGVYTRYYRAPEICDDDDTKKYDEKAEVWAYGCLLSELYRRRPPIISETDDEHLTMIKSRLANCTQIKDLKYIIPQWSNMPDDPLLIDLLAHCFAYNPEDRYSIYEVLEHDYFKQNLSSNVCYNYSIIPYNDILLERMDFVSRDVIIENRHILINKAVQLYYKHNIHSSIFVLSIRLFDMVYNEKHFNHEPYIIYKVCLCLASKICNKNRIIYKDILDIPMTTILHYETVIMKKLKGRFIPTTWYDFYINNSDCRALSAEQRVRIGYTALLIHMTNVSLKYNPLQIYEMVFEHIIHDKPLPHIIINEIKTFNTTSIYTFYKKYAIIIECDLLTS